MGGEGEKKSWTKRRAKGATNELRKQTTVEWRTSPRGSLVEWLTVTGDAFFSSFISLVLGSVASFVSTFYSAPHELSLHSLKSRPLWALSFFNHYNTVHRTSLFNWSNPIIPASSYFEELRLELKEEEEQKSERKKEKERRKKQVELASWYSIG